MELGFSALQHKIDLGQQEVRVLKEQVGKLDTRLTQQNDKMEARFDKMEARFDKQGGKLDANTDTLNQIKGISFALGAAMSAVGAGAAAMKGWELLQTAGKAAETIRYTAATVDKAIVGSGP